MAEARISRQADGTKDSLPETAGGWAVDPGPTSARELRPAAGTVQGSRPPWGNQGCSQVLRGPRRHGPGAGHCKLLGIVWGREGGRRG